MKYNEWACKQCKNGKCALILKSKQNPNKGPFVCPWQHMEVDILVKWEKIE